MSVRKVKTGSLLRAAVWLCVGPFVAIGGLALIALGFAVLAVTFQLLAALLKHTGI
jgi:hypothetical protein